MKLLNDENYTLVISVKMFEELKTLASTMTNDFGEVQFEDTDSNYEAGTEDGQILLARQILEDARIPWRIIEEI